MFLKNMHDAVYNNNMNFSFMKDRYSLTFIGGFSLRHYIRKAMYLYEPGKRESHITSLESLQCAKL